MSSFVSKSADFGKLPLKTIENSYESLNVSHLDLNHSRQTGFVHPPTNILLDIVYGVLQLLGNGMTAQTLHIEIVGFRWENHESHHRYIGQLTLQVVIEASQRFDKHISTFVSKLVPSSNEHIQRFVQIKIEMTVEMAASEFIDLFLGDGVEILEFVNGREFLDIQTVWCDDIGFSFQQMLRLVAGNVRNGGEGVSQMGGCPFDTVPMIDLTFTSLFVDREFIQIVVEISCAGAQITSQQCGMSGKHGSDIDTVRSASNQTDTGLPFVELSDNVWSAIAIIGRVPFHAVVELGQEFGNHKAQNDGIIRFNVQMGDACEWIRVLDLELDETNETLTNIRRGPQVLLERVQLPGTGTDVEKNDLGVAIDQPATGDNLEKFPIINNQFTLGVILNKPCSPFAAYEPQPSSVDCPWGNHILPLPLGHNVPHTVPSDSRTLPIPRWRQTPLTE